VPNDKELLQVALDALQIGLKKVEFEWRGMSSYGLLGEKYTAN